MTGRELILYILENHLEEEEIFKDDKITGLQTVSEAAQRFEVGRETVHSWIKLGYLDSVIIFGKIFIPENAVLKQHG